MSKTVNWQVINSALPYSKSEEDRKKREKLFKQMDPNGNGYLSVAEIDKGLVDMPKELQLLRQNEVLLRAFNAAKEKEKSSSQVGKDFIQKKEFRFFLLYLRQYYEYFKMFEQIDSDGNGKIDLEQFKNNIPLLKKWGVNIADPDAEFKLIDADSGGSILFREFSHYCIQKSLDIEDDGEDNQEAEKNLKKDGWDPKKQEQYGHYENHTKLEQVQQATQKPINWSLINSALPSTKSEQDKKKRDQLFKKMDPNGNGYLSVAEIDKGLVDMPSELQVLRQNEVLLRAFNAAKEKGKSSAEVGQDFIQKNEFRYFLLYLRQYFEYFKMFEQIDTTGDGKISLEEFKKNIPLMKKWGVSISNPEAEFKLIDADSGGSILFREFSHYCIQKSLDIEDDGEDDLEAVEGLKKDGWDPKKQEIYRHYDPHNKSEKDHAAFIKGINIDKIDWEKINKYLPAGNSDMDKKIRNMLFKMWDPNGNGYLSLAEIDKGFKDLGPDMEIIYMSKAPMLRAFNAAKEIFASKEEVGQDFIQKPEFRMFLLYLRQYFEYFVMFKKMDTSGDGRLGLDEFKQAIPLLKKWGAKIDNPEDEFKKIDKNGGGILLFDEFSHYCITQTLDLDDDGDDSKFQEAAKGLLKDGYDPNKPVVYRHFNAGLTQAQKDQQDHFVKDTKISDINWEVIKENLACGNSDKDKKKRDQMFKDMDPNGNGFLSLAEIDRGFNNMGPKMQIVFLAKAPMLRAFNAAKDHYKDKSANKDLASDFVQKKEFRIFLLYLRQYFEYFVMFKKMDTSGDNKLSKKEFIEAIPNLKKWGVLVTDVNAEFDNIDTNKGGEILFDEFSHYCIQKSLDLEDDGDDTEFVDAQKGLTVDHKDPTKTKFRHYNAGNTAIEQEKQNQFVKGTKISDINWQKINENLPCGTDEQSSKKRIKMFNEFDPNKNGLISLAEVDRGFGLMGKDMELVFLAKAPQIRAFNAAKDHSKAANSEKKQKSDDDTIDKNEFRILLMYLRQYFEYFVMFKKMDTSGDNKISIKEFTAAQPLIKKWGVNIKDPKSEFKSIDKNGGGVVLFDEFSHYCITKSLDLENDGDDSQFQDAAKGLVLDHKDPTKTKFRHYQAQMSKDEIDKQNQFVKGTKLSDINWRVIADNLPCGTDKKETEKREKIFNLWDPNHNGFLSLAEIGKGFTDMGKNMMIVAQASSPMIRAFNAAKDHFKASGNHNAGNDYVDIQEFRFFLLYLRQYFEYFVMFKKMDTTKDDKMTLQEFTKAIPSLKKWGVEFKDPKVEFKKIDTNNGGVILFDEFAEYCILKSLDLTDDGEDSQFQEGQKGLVNAHKSLKDAKFSAKKDYKDLTPIEQRPKIDFVALKKLLPIQDTEVDKQKREQLFCQFDPNKNNYLSLAEIDKGLRDLGDQAKPFGEAPKALIQAFKASKDYYKSKTKLGEDFIERQEFRIFLIYLYQYFEYYQMFRDLDTNNDQRIDFTEFKKGLSILSKWGIDIRNPEVEFRKIDLNSGGHVLFDEFADFCIRKSLDIQNPRVILKLKTSKSSNSSTQKDQTDDNASNLKPKPISKLPRQNANKKKTELTLESLQKLTEELLNQNQILRKEQVDLQSELQILKKANKTKK